MADKYCLVSQLILIFSLEPDKNVCIFVFIVLLLDNDCRRPETHIKYIYIYIIVCFFIINNTLDNIFFHKSQSKSTVSCMVSAILRLGYICRNWVLHLAINCREARPSSIN